jgi:diguanylate cyclase (GGDEF)-like protein
MAAILLLTLVIGIVNVSLGYALAAYLGLAPPTLADALQAVMAQRPADDWTLADSDDDVDRLILQLGDPSGPPQVHACLLALGQIALQQGERLAEIDARLRAETGELDRTLLYSETREASQVCRAWLGWQRRAMDRFRECAGQLGEKSHLAGEVEAAVEELSARIQGLVETQRRLRQCKAAAEAVAEAARQYRDDLSRLGRAIHKTRDILATIAMAAVEQTGRRPEVHDTCRVDPLTGLPSRIGLEILVRGWWEEKRQESAPLTAALIAPDCFAECNQEHGVATGDKVLRAMAETIVGQVGPQAMVARYAGPDFLVLLPGTALADAAASVEQVRQSLSALDHAAAAGTFRRTVSAAVVETIAGETPESLFARLEEELDQANRAGGNQSHSPPISAPSPK